VRASHALGIGLRAGCALFLFYSAWKLWREGGVAVTSDRPVSFRRVFIATLLNPKGIIFAFVIVPYLGLATLALALPYMAALMAFIGLAGGSWIAGGAMLRAGASRTLSAGFARRAGALILCVFAALISASTFSA
jgi:threonine/homoserine/homoserine lactone efflux protein